MCWRGLRGSSKRCQDATYVTVREHQIVIENVQPMRLSPYGIFMPTEMASGMS